VGENYDFTLDISETLIKNLRISPVSKYYLPITNQLWIGTHQVYLVKCSKKVKTMSVSFCNFEYDFIKNKNNICKNVVVPNNIENIVVYDDINLVLPRTIKNFTAIKWTGEAILPTSIEKIKFDKCDKEINISNLINLKKFEIRFGNSINLIVPPLHLKKFDVFTGNKKLLPNIKNNETEWIYDNKEKCYYKK
jgi:hypothetical protein